MRDYAKRYRRMIPLADMGEFDMEKALPSVGFVWPDERLDELAEKIGADAWDAAEAVLNNHKVQAAETKKEQQEAVKEVLWTWLQDHVRKTL
jgi:hypothetical protein